MNLAANIVTYTVDAEHAEELLERVRHYLLPAAQQATGYLGFILLDQGDGKRMAVLLFDSLEAAQSAPRTLTPVGQQYIYDLLTVPAEGSQAKVILVDGVLGGNT